VISPEHLHRGFESSDSTLWAVTVGIGVHSSFAVTLLRIWLAEYLLGPLLMTIGPWKPIALHTYQNRISDVDVRSQVSESLAVKLIADLSFSEQAPGFASFVLKNATGSIEASASKIPTGKGHCRATFDWAPGKLDLWYPVGYGAQSMYMVEVVLTDEVRLLWFVLQQALK
jgi:hypothetical protein